MSNLKLSMDYPRFSKPPYRILYLNDHYFLQNQSIHALRKLGHQVLTLPVLHDNAPGMMEAILKAAVIFKPDAVMSVNHGGFDPQGHIAAALSGLKLPVLHWYLDDFRYILLNSELHNCACSAVFTFDKDHLSLLKQDGFEHSFYLPGAASVSANKNYTDDAYAWLNNSLTFVGSTFSATRDRYDSPGYPALFNQLRQHVDLRSPQRGLVALIRRLQGHLFENDGALNHYAGYVSAAATAVRRQHYLGKLGNHNLHVFGDDAWKQMELQATLHPPVQLETEAPKVYRATAVNLNISSQQLGSAVNLRVFDVPASGGFLLTEWNESLTGLFDVDSEIAAFRDVEEMQDLARFYLAKESTRRAITERARQRVRKQHLLRHRMQEMLNTACDLWG